MKTNCFNELFRMAAGKDNFLGVANGTGDKALVDYINSILDNFGVSLSSREGEDKKLYNALIKLSKGNIFNRMQKVTPVKDFMLTEGVYLWIDPKQESAILRVNSTDFTKYATDRVKYVLGLTSKNEHVSRLSGEFFALKKIVKLATERNIRNGTYYVSGGVFCIDGAGMSYLCTAHVMDTSPKERRLYELMDMLTDSLWLRVVPRAEPVRGGEYIIANTYARTVRLDTYEKEFEVEGDCMLDIHGWEVDLR